MGTPAASPPQDAGAPPRVPRRVVGAVVLGTLLNPLNSSMIAVALARIRADFSVSLAAASWLVSGFYLTASVGQPLMGRLADRLGPKRIFCAGWVVVAASSVLASLAPAFGVLVVARFAQALGTSTAFPAGLAMIRALARGGAPGSVPTGALGAVSVANTSGAALGPVVGGALVGLAGWPAIFTVNLALAAVGLPLALRWLPAGRAAGGGRPAAGDLDLAGVALFAGTLAAVVGLLLSLPGGPLWFLLPLAAAGAIALVAHERRRAEPFLDVRMLAANRPLLAVYGQFVAVNVVFYSVFFGLPLWLEEARGVAPAHVGLLLLPVAGLGVITTPLAARLVRTIGIRPVLVIGSVGLTLGALALLGLDTGTSTLAVVGIAAVLGVPNGFNNLGLQAALYRHAPAAQMGAASGLFQTSRYLGAILATSMLGVAFARSTSTAGLHALALALAVLAGLIVLASLVSGRRV